MPIHVQFQTRDAKFRLQSGTCTEAAWTEALTAARAVFAANGDGLTPITLTFDTGRTKELTARQITDAEDNQPEADWRDVWY